MHIVVEEQMRENQKDVLKGLAAGCKTILEIGCWVGESTTILATAVRPDGHVTCIDWFKGNPKTRLWKKTERGKYADKIYNIFLMNMFELGLLDYITVYRGDSRIMHPFVKDNFFDLVYIDADHRYSRASLDIKKYLPKVKQVGIIAGHDFESFDYKKEFIECDWKEKKHHGTIKAVVEAFDKNKITVREGIWWVRV